MLEKIKSFSNSLEGKVTEIVVASGLSGINFVYMLDNIAHGRYLHAAIDGVLSALLIKVSYDTGKSITRGYAKKQNPT